MIYRDRVVTMDEEDTEGATLTPGPCNSVPKVVRRGLASLEESDTMEGASENEVDNLPKDQDDQKQQLVKVDEEPEPNRLSPNRTEVVETQQRRTTARIFLQSSSSSNESNQAATIARYGGAKINLFRASKSPQSSSSQEDYEPEQKMIPKQHLLSANTRQMSARSMESLRTSRNFLSADDRCYSEDSRSLESLSSSSETHAASRTYRSFLTSSKKDVRRIITLESRSSDNLHREESLNAEVRRGLFANMGIDRKLPQHLSLPPPSNVFSLTSPGGSDRRITILSPHSPLPGPPDYSGTFSLKTRRKKAIVLPRLVLPRSESEVFLE